MAKGVFKAPYDPEMVFAHGCAFLEASVWIASKSKRCTGACPSTIFIDPAEDKQVNIMFARVVNAAFSAELLLKCLRLLDTGEWNGAEHSLIELFKPLARGRQMEISRVYMAKEDGFWRWFRGTYAHRQRRSGEADECLR
jgi:hypothetical protein